LRKFIFIRFLYMIVVVVFATLFVFLMSRASGDPRTLYLSEYTTKADWDKWGEEMGLDRPIFVQYVTWLGKAVRGEFGTSLRDQIDAFDVIKARIPATLQLSGGALLFATIVGVPLGVLSAVRRGSFWDYAARIFSLGGQSVPGFWLGIMLILLFAVQLELLPTGRRGGIDHYILPSIALGWSSAAGFTRLIRSAMLEILDSEYVVFARAKGVNSRVIIWKHAFKNAVIVPLTFSGLLVASYITGTVVTETVFAWPGLGRLAVDAVFNNDFPVITGVVLIFTLIYVVINLFVDIAYAVIDPRIRY
jgi:peptide/nickel transport system permease protein